MKTGIVGLGLRAANVLKMLIEDLPELDLVKQKNKLFARELANFDMPKVYRAVNAMQTTAFKINNYILGVMAEAWDRGLSIGGMPPITNLTVPNKPHDIKDNKEWFFSGALSLFTVFAMITLIHVAMYSIEPSIDFIKQIKLFWTYEEMGMHPSTSNQGENNVADCCILLPLPNPTNWLIVECECK